MTKYHINLIKELKPLVEIPFADKLPVTKVLIERNLREHPGKAVVSWSGGKDSTVVLYLVRQLEPNIDVVFNNTGVEYPETVNFVHEWAATWGLNLIETRPMKNFWKCAAEWGFPDGHKGGKTATAPHCCWFLKEKPMLDAIRAHGWEANFDGVTAVESQIRMFTARDKGTCYFKKHWKVKIVHPILYWTESEVLDFIDAEGLPKNPLYEGRLTRVGCMTCTAYKNWEAIMAAESPKLYSIIKLRKDGQYSFRT